MNISRRNLVLIVVSLLLVLLLIAMSMLSEKKSEKFSETTTLKNDVVYEVNTLQVEETKMEEFILSHIHDPNVFNDFSVNWEGGSAKEFPLQILYTSISEKDINLLMSAFTSESMKEISRLNQTYEEKEDRLLEYIDNLSRDGRLSKLSYNFIIDQYDIEGNEGILHFNYNDGKAIDIPFILETSEGDGHAHEDEGEGVSYQIGTTLQEITEQINKFTAK